MSGGEMEFVPAKCPNCAGDLMLPDSGEFSVCSYCGSRFLLKNALLKPPVASVENWIKLAKNALLSCNYHESLEYCNRILEVDADSRIAWFMKGTSSGKLSSPEFPRIHEMVLSYRKVLGLSNSENIDKNVDAIAKESQSILHTVVDHQLQELIDTLLSTTLIEARRKGSNLHVETTWKQIKSYSKELLQGVDLLLEVESRNQETASIGLIITNKMLSTSKVKYHDFKFNKVRIEKSSTRIEEFKDLRNKYISIIKQGNPSARIQKPGKAKSASCFVATATMGDYNHHYVYTLRRYRDTILVNKCLGKVVINVYYSIGPYIAEIIHRSENARKISLEYIVEPAYKLARKRLTGEKNNFY
jgi:DNA-directed RNA polymerase subunit RPC12/RpoP